MRVLIYQKKERKFQDLVQDQITKVTDKIIMFNDEDSQLFLSYDSLFWI